ncbi:MAG: fibronectin type III domain-containing protein [Faecalibacterium sp.]|nr:fibronectin type III domain-containing protein [Ruminococcus sp.]MCM1392020.1 fibronectin type III domain-containing protein [Ruminococcus sp.]MCM1485720.1 fibronectin type III domain-containing protein [Faecalibacterium sp.]
MKVTKRVVSLILSLLMIFTVMTPVVTAKAAYENDLPIVYVKGNGRTIYNKNGKKISPTPSLTDRIEQNTNAIAKAYLKSNDKNGYAPLKEEIKKIIDPIYKDLVLDNNGNVTNGSYPQKNPSPAKKKSGYTLSDYSFEYDSRLDPYVLAKQLNTYINDVLKATGKKKVQLVSRCMGTAIATTYLTEYGSSKIDTAVFYAGALKGLLPISAMFAGDFNIDYTNLRQYVKTNSDSDFADLLQALTLVMSILDTATLGIGRSALNAKFTKIAKEIMPDLILSTYGTMPAYWALVGEEYYDDAKEFVFGGQTSKYAGIISKADKYQNNVQRKLYKTLQNLQKKGMKIAVIAKYNVSLMPLFTHGNQQADGLVELNKMSLGARCSDVGKALSINYIDYVFSNGKSKYISADQAIDASTCLFPDYTWFIKDSAHSDWASSINNLIYAILHSKKQYTINSNSKYPQFLQYKSNNKLVKLESTSALARTNPAVSSYMLGKTTFTYDGTDKKPYTIVIGNDGNALNCGTDYTVTYEKDSKSVGTHKATIKMKGYFTGSKTLSYKIVPATVSGLKASTTTSSVKLTWSSVKGATGYRIQRYDTANSKWVTLKTVKATSYTNTGLSVNKTYKYRVAAYKTVNGKDIYGSNSSSISAKTVPSKVTGLKASATPSSVTLSWSKVDGITGYQVQRYDSKNKRWIKLANTSKTSYTNSKLTINTTYKYRVVAYKNVNSKSYFGDYSSTVSAKTLPAKVTGLKASATTNSITLSWSKVSGATNYTVYSYNKSNKSYKKIKTVTGTSLKITGLKTATSYSYAVMATKVSGGKNYNGSKSSVLVTGTSPTAPKLDKLTAGSKQATVTWNKISCTGYELYMATSKDGSYSKIKTAGSSSTVSFKKTGLKSGQTYYFKVRAYKTYGSTKVYSSYSAVKSVKVK